MKRPKIVWLVGKKKEEGENEKHHRKRRQKYDENTDGKSLSAPAVFPLFSSLPFFILF